MLQNTRTRPRTPTGRKYVWSYRIGDEVHGGMKARLDSVAFLRGSGHWTVFDTGTLGPLPVRAAKFVGSLFWLLRQPRDSVFFVQYPAHGPRIQRLVARILYYRFQTVALLHDLDELRTTTTVVSRPVLRKAAAIVSTGLLHERIPDELAGKPISFLEIWDYRVGPAFKPGGWDPAGPILYAGTLWPLKVSWLYRPDPGRPALLLRGHGYDTARDPGCGDTFAGPFESDDPVFDPPASWGLVWDGAKLGSEGTEADYERINQPHKLSLYLACGLPVIVWSEGRAADWVLRNGCGITTPSLAAIPGILARVTPAGHAAMRERSQALGEDVRAGRHLLDALARLGF